MIPMHETPIYAQLKAERQAEAVSEFMKGVGVAFQSIIDAFKPFIKHVMTFIKAMQRYDMSTGQPVRNPGMKPLIHNGKARR